MKYKVSQPEDYTDIEGYAFKLAKAYSIIYGDLLMALTHIDTMIELLKEEPYDDLMREYMVKVLDKFVSKFRE